MRVITGLLVALVLASGLALQAQGKARDCGLYIEIKSGLVTSSPAKTACEFGGKLNLMVVNLDEEEYSLGLQNFHFNSGTPQTCNKTNPVGDSPTTPPGVKQHVFTIHPHDTLVRQKPVKAKGANKTECYKFDIALWDSNGNPLPGKDPDLEVTEPPPPPPGTGPVKPPPMDDRR